ncbi:MAG: hypothetical protein HKL80_09855 [Acidimicrobiales bacterium]|nr:hypothetical protein [Acidimicrobiales bacterium]
MSDSDINKEAFEVLQIVLSKFGLNALSDSSIIEGICEDRLSDYPRESTLIVTAARAGIVGLLQQQVNAVGVEDAIKLTADSLSTKFSIANNASLWVTSQFAKVLGYDLDDQPTINLSHSESNLNSPPIGNTLTPNTPATGLIVEPTIFPGQGPINQSPDSTSQPNPHQLAQSGLQQPMYPGGPLGPNYPPSPTGTSGQQNQKKNLIYVGVVVALVVAYMVIAGVANLPPFTKSTPTNVLIPTTTNGTSSSGNSGSTTTSRGSTNQSTDLSKLQTYIPQSLQQAGGCSQSSTEKSGAVVAIDCTVSTSANIPLSQAVYFIFSSNADLYSYYDYLLTKYVVTQNQLSCSNFATFVLNCEEEYSVGGTNRGRVTEVNYQSQPFVIATVDSQNIVIASIGPLNATGDSLVTWWQTSGNWDTKF